MKKIILFLLLLISSSFADGFYNYNGTCYSTGRYCSQKRWELLPEPRPDPLSYNENRCMDAYGNSFPYRTYMEGDYQVTDFLAWVVPSSNCATLPPTCSTGSHLDTATNQCVGDFAVSNSATLDSGTKIIYFADGAVMTCRPNGECETLDSQNNIIANRWYNGSVPPTYSNLKDFASYVLSPVGNFLGKVLQVAGVNIVMTGTGGGALIYKANDASVMLNALNPVFTAGSGLVSLGNLLVSEEDKIFTTPSTQGVLNVNIVENPSSISVSDLSSSSNGELTQKSYEVDTIQSEWKSAGGTGTFPLLSMTPNTTVSYDATYPNTAVLNSPDKLTIVETKSDNSATVTEIQKQDIANTVNNNTDLAYTQKEITPPKINNDGTLNQTETTTPKSVSPTTNTPVSFDPKTGNPEIVDFNPKTGARDGLLYSFKTGLPVTNDTGKDKTKATVTPNATGTGSVINLSGVVTALDKISNQLTKQNDFQKKLDEVKDGAFSHGLPKADSPYDWTSYDTSFTHLKNTSDGLLSDIESLKTLYSSGLSTLNLTGGVVVTCPYNYTLDLGFTSLPVTLDLCDSLSPARPVFYMFFYLFFLVSIGFFGFKTMLRLL